MQKLRSDLSQEILCIIPCSIFCLPCAIRNCKDWDIHNYKCCLLFCMGVKLREERRLRTFENRVLREIVGPKRDAVTGEWRKLHNEKLIDLYCSPHVTLRVIKWKRVKLAGHVARMGKIRGAKRVLVGKPVKNKQLGRPKLRWENDIKINLQEME